MAALERGAFQYLNYINLFANDIRPEGAKAVASALERGSFQSLWDLVLRDNLIGAEGAEAVAIALEHSTLPRLENVNLNGNRGVGDSVLKRVRVAVAGARQRGRVLSLLGAESDRCNSPARRFLARDGDRAVMCRVWGFMLS